MVTLRPFQPDDLSALYAISLATGHVGGDASRLYEDPGLVGPIHSAPYFGGRTIWMGREAEVLV